jgi:hypothetical protein
MTTRGHNTIYGTIVSKREIKHQKICDKFGLILDEYRDFLYWKRRATYNLSLEEFADRKNILTYIENYYHPNIDTERINYNDNWIMYENYNYFISNSYCRTGLKKFETRMASCYFCNRECKCGLDHKIDEKYHKYDETTGIWRHIKRLPDIDAHINCGVMKDTVKNITSKKHYILDNKFYWKYTYNNNKWIIKFYPNLHDDIGYLIEKICKMDATILNECIKNETYNLFYLISIMPLDIRNIIKSYL